MKVWSSHNIQTEVARIKLYDKRAEWRQSNVEFCSPKIAIFNYSYQISLTLSSRLNCRLVLYNLYSTYYVYTLLEGVHLPQPQLLHILLLPPANQSRNRNKIITQPRHQTYIRIEQGISRVCLSIVGPGSLKRSNLSF